MNKKEREEIDIQKLAKDIRKVYEILENENKDLLEKLKKYLEILKYDRKMALLKVRNNITQPTKENARLRAENTKIRSELYNLKHEIKSQVDNEIQKKIEINQFTEQENYQLKTELEKQIILNDKWKLMFTQISLANAKLINKGE